MSVVLKLSQTYRDIADQQHSDLLPNGDTCVILFSATTYQYISETLPSSLPLLPLCTYTFYYYNLSFFLLLMICWKRLMSSTTVSYDLMIFFSPFV